jgi:predicted RNA binding protein YcfA (HicA-like mRNA interferase family)
MKVRDIIQLLQNDGWQLTNVEGDHRHFVYRLKTGKVTVSGHPRDDIHPKTLKSMLRQAGLEE